MTTEELIAEANEHIDKAADAAPPRQQRAIRSGLVADDRLRLLVHLKQALELAEAECDRLRAECFTAHGDLVMMAMEIGWATDGCLETAVQHAREVLRVRTAERDGLAAVIEEAESYCLSDNDVDWQDVVAILSKAPADALREVKAQAWDEGQGAGTVAALNFTPLEPNPYRKEADHD